MRSMNIARARRELGAGGAEGPSPALVRAILENERCWHDVSLADRHKGLLGGL